MAQTRMPRLSPRTARLCIIGIALLLPVGQLGLIVRPWQLSTAAEVALAVVFLSALGLAIFVMTGTPGWRREARGDLDEREAADTANVLSLSYRIIGVLLLALTLWYGLATHENSFGLTPPGSRAVMLLLLNLFWLQLLLPSTILAWRDRDVDGQD
jgi:hypothetical protein